MNDTKLNERHRKDEAKHIERIFSRKASALRDTLEKLYALKSLDSSRAVSALMEKNMEEFMNFETFDINLSELYKGTKNEFESKKDAADERRLKIILKTILEKHAEENAGFNKENDKDITEFLARTLIGRKNSPQIKNRFKRISARLAASRNRNTRGNT